MNLSSAPAAATDLSAIRRLVHDVPDFPKPGVLFKDITPLLADPAGFAMAIAELAGRIERHSAQGIVAIESRGFIFGAAVALRLGLPLLPVRKPGKLPRRTVTAAYQLEYGADRIEMHHDAVVPGRRYAVVDDVIATGGTAAAAAELVAGQGATVACLAFLIELDFLGGRSRLGQTPVESLLRY